MISFRNTVACLQAIVGLMQKLFKSLIKSDYEKFFHKHRALWDLSVPLTLQSRWRIERFSFKSILTWNYLFSIYFIKKLGLDSLHSFHSFRSRWRVRNHFFAKYSDVNYFVLYATFNKVRARLTSFTSLIPVEMTYWEYICKALWRELFCLI